MRCSCSFCSNEFLVGIHRDGNVRSNIAALNHFYCCQACAGGEVLQREACAEANWGIKLDWPTPANDPAVCAPNKYLVGLWKNWCHELHCIEHGMYSTKYLNGEMRSCNSRYPSVQAFAVESRAAAVTKRVSAQRCGPEQCKILVGRWHIQIKATSSISFAVCFDPIPHGITSQATMVEQCSANWMPRICASRLHIKVEQVHIPFIQRFRARTYTEISCSHGAHV